MHIHVHYHYVRERLEESDFSLAYVPTIEKIADLHQELGSREVPPILQFPTLRR